MNVTELVPKIQSMQNVSSPNRSYKACVHVHTLTHWHTCMEWLYYKPLSIC